MDYMILVYVAILAAAFVLLSVLYFATRRGRHS